MRVLDFDAYVARSGALDFSAIAWEDVPRFPLPAVAVRTLRYMQDIESHTIIYLRSLLATYVGWADVHGGCNGNGHH